MTEREDMTIGEIGRAMQRIESSFAEYRKGHHDQIQGFNRSLIDLSLKIDRYIAPVAVLEERHTVIREDVKELQDEMKDISKKAAQVSLLGAIGALIVGLFPLPWKHS